MGCERRGIDDPVGSLFQRRQYLFLGLECLLDIPLDRVRPPGLFKPPQQNILLRLKKNDFASVFTFQRLQDMVNIGQKTLLPDIYADPYLFYPGVP
jgi:hypothetical protein